MAEKSPAAPEAVDLLEASDPEFIAAFDKLYALTWARRRSRRSTRS